MAITQGSRLEAISCRHNLSIRGIYWDGNHLLSDSMRRFRKWSKTKEGMGIRDDPQDVP